MRKFIFGGIAVLVIATAVAFNVNFSSQKDKMSSLSLSNIEALAQENDGNLWKGYLNNVSDCKISETVRCDFEIWIPGLGYCDLGFSYVIKHDGKHNPCTYTGNLNNFCDYYQCKRNT